MRPSGLHLLLTYECTLECDHCFVWGSPNQRGTMTLKTVREILRQALATGYVEWIYFEGGEPFLFYPVLRKAVRAASRMGFRVGIVSNAYWATSREDAAEWLRPLRGRIQDLSLSEDRYHGNEELNRCARNAEAAAKRLGIPAGFIRIAQPEDVRASAAVGQLPPGESAVMFRGRAAEVLAPKVPPRPWAEFTTCPFENLRNPGRVHLDALGFVHVCDGISIGNLFRTPLATIFSEYDPETHPITGPLLAGGPAELARRYGTDLRDGYADACHLCYETRGSLRGRFPEALGPDPMYGVPGKA